MRLWLVSLSATFLLVGWVYVHTDEIPFVLGFLLVCAFILGFAFPRWFLVSGVVLGFAYALEEFLIAWGLLRAPFEGGHPLQASISLLPALLGSLAGSAIARSFAARPNRHG